MTKLITLVKIHNELVILSHKELAMSRIGLTKDILLQSAMEMVDAEGAQHLTLKALADKLNVRPPSLYNYFGSVAELHTSLMLYGWKLLENQVMRAAVGKTKDDAIKSMCSAYLEFSMKHTGMFDIMQSYNQHNTQETKAATSDLISTLRQVLSAYNLSAENEVHIIRIFRSFLQGYVYLIKNDSFGKAVSVQDSFNVAVDVLLKGLTTLKG